MKRLGYLAVVLIWSCMGCAKTGEVVPNVAVYYTKALAHQDLIPIKSINGAVIVKGGVAGIIIFHSVNGYVAYDACSSYQPQNRCAVTLDNPSLTATDPCSGSRFSLSDGIPVKAPASRSLKRYAVYADDFNITISN